MKEYIDAIKKYAVFNGRATRKEYWMFTLYNFLVGLAYQIIIGLILAPFGTFQFTENKQPTPFFFLFILISLLYPLFMLLPSYSLAVRRVHDTGHNGWWASISTIKVGINHFTFAIGQLLFLPFSLRDSQPGENKYGPNPKGVQNNNPTTNSI